MRMSSLTFPCSPAIGAASSIPSAKWHTQAERDPATYQRHPHCPVDPRERDEGQRRYAEGPVVHSQQAPVHPAVRRVSRCKGGQEAEKVPWLADIVRRMSILRTVH